MMAKRTVLLGMLICLTAGAAFGQVGVGAAVVAPTTEGDIGLLTMPTADNPRAGQFTLGIYGLLEQRIAGPLVLGDDDQIRVFRHWAGTGSIGLGLTNWWSIFASRRPRGHARAAEAGSAGVVNGIPLVGPFDVQEGEKIRLGTKFNFHSEADPELPHGPLAGRAHPDLQRDDPHRRERDAHRPAQLAPRRLGVGRRGYEGHLHGHGLVHDGRASTTTGHPAANELRFGVGVEIPIDPHRAPDRRGRPQRPGRRRPPGAGLLDADGGRPHLDRRRPAGPCRPASTPTWTCSSSTASTRTRSAASSASRTPPGRRLRRRRSSFPRRSPSSRRRRVERSSTPRRPRRLRVPRPGRPRTRSSSTERARA